MITDERMNTLMGKIEEATTDGDLSDLTQDDIGDIYSWMLDYLTKREQDTSWIDAMKPYWGGGTVPFWKNADGSIDAERTMEHFARMHGLSKIGPNGEDSPWPTK